RDDLDRGDLDEPEQVTLAVPAGADQPDPPGLPLVEPRGPPAPGGRRHRQAGGAGPEARASVHVHPPRSQNPPAGPARPPPAYTTPRTRPRGVHKDSPRLGHNLAHIKVSKPLRMIDAMSARRSSRNFE